jgi:ribosomal protein S18 acetylase RimI-like enzyme
VDLATLQCALACAIEWRSAATPSDPVALIEKTGHAYLLEGWGRSGDVAVVAELAGSPVGAAWYRFWTDAAHSYGYLDPETPELGVGVDAAHRGRGVGTALLAALIDGARQRGVRALSLSVESDNPAVALYSRLGFERACNVDNACTMLKRLETVGVSV